MQFLYYTTLRMFAKRVQNLLPSPTIAIDVKTKAYKREGIPVINLSVGEPDFQTPENIKNAGRLAITNDYTFYTAPNGILELRKAIVDKFARDNKLSYSPEDVIVGVGAKELLYIAFQVLCDNNDEVIIPLPTWITFSEQVKLADGKPVFIKLKSPFKLTAKDIQSVLTPKTKIILLNSPSNPSGAMIALEELKKIADIAVKKKIIVIADEIYEKLIYTSQHHSIAALNDQIKQQTITINGVSKSYAMTGWRIGYAAGPKEIIKKMVALQSQLLTHASSISQVAAVEALNGEQKSIQLMVNAFKKRRLFCLNQLKKSKKLAVIDPDGAFYLFISLKKILGKKYKTATEWAEALLEKEKVAVVPGEAFFYPGYIRLSFAASDIDLQEAMKRIKRFVDS